MNDRPRTGWFESVILLKQAPELLAGASPHDFVLGEPSDGVLLVHGVPALVVLGIYAEFVHVPSIVDYVWSIELFAKERLTDRTWFLGVTEVRAVAPDPDWDDLIIDPLLFDVVLEVDVSDLDVWIVMLVDGEPDAPRPIYLRPRPPDSLPPRQHD